MKQASKSARKRSAPFVPSRVRVWLSALRYLSGRVLTIFLTIFAGVFITVLLANQPPVGGVGPATSPFEIKLESQIDRLIEIGVYNGTIKRLQDGSADPDQVSSLREQLRRQAGLELPFLPRYLLWTIKALSFNWGSLTAAQTVTAYGQAISFNENDVVLERLPNTLLLVGTAYLLIFLIGMPLSLYLARNYDGWLDRFFAAISPISSIPSWVIAVLLIALFAVQLRWLPVGGKTDTIEIYKSGQHALDLIRHMTLPVVAIVLSLLFQIVYTWRTFFIIYSGEDYVDLARAKGLPARILERQYILRPSLPYVMTSFATTLISFWQFTVALEAVFQWPGIGWLYIREALPNYWGERIYPGNLILVIEIVVIFAYLLGMVVFLLDLAYVLVDPRIHLLPSQNAGPGRVKGQRSWLKRLLEPKAIPRKKIFTGSDRSSGHVRTVFSLKNSANAFVELIQNMGSRSRLFLHELRKYPAAIFGLLVITTMVLGSIYAVIALPYEEYGSQYNVSRVSGRNYVPRVAAPLWTDTFRSVPRLSRIILNERSLQTQSVLRTLENGWVEKNTTFTFDYSYGEFPSDVFLYLDANYDAKIPHVSMVWSTPDGRDINLKPKAIDGNVVYDFAEGIPVRRLINTYPEWKKWFVLDGQHPTPAYDLLFATPGSKEPSPAHGRYQLEITSLLFEEGSDVQAELILLGQVYGMAGTDYWRRDLIIPLLWGMPFALLIGLFGTLIIVIIAILLPAIGVWYGGWLDDLIQRLTEVNMVLPGLTIAVLAYALFAVNIWVILGFVVVLNAFGSPIKTFRSALLQAREATYIDAARAYGAGNVRIITRYLIPRILPVLVPQLVMQVPGFIFLEATLGFFNIKSNYPSWGHVIYSGLSQGALYGSPFWVLLPISLLLLTGFAFAMLGSALERILNPRMLDQVPESAKTESRKNPRMVFAVGLCALVLMAANLIPIKEGKTFVKFILDLGRPPVSSVVAKTDPPAKIPTPTASVSLPTDEPATATATSTLPEPVLSPTVFPTPTFTPEVVVILETIRPQVYSLRPNEFPYCIARRFDVDPNELLLLNGMTGMQTFYTGMTLQIPQTGNPFPFERMLQVHPATYVVSTSNENIYGIACLFGDVSPQAIAQANQLSVDSALYAGQVLNIP